MANVKRTSTSGNARFSKARKTIKKKSNKTAQNSPQDAKAPIFVRISQDAKNILDEAAEFPLPSITNVRVIERLLEYFNNQNRTTQKAILSGIYENPIAKSEDWQASLLWAQHAYENERFDLAAKLYEPLAKDSDRSEKFISFCNYKLGLCWMGISSESRNKALFQKNKANDYQSFTHALDALKTAIDYTKEMKGDLGGPLSNLIKHYNLACCYSMRAQFKVEARIDLNEDQITELRKATDFTSTKKAWEKIGKNWRSDDKRTDIDIEAQKALKELQEIFSLSSLENSLDSIDLPINPDLLPDRIWLVEAALKDEDLIFLHTDEKWQSEFNKWTEGALLGNTSITDRFRI